MNNNNNSSNTPNPNANTNNKDSEEDLAAQPVDTVIKPDKSDTLSSAAAEEEASAKSDDPMDEDSVTPATVFCIRLKQPRSNLQHKMSVPELCRNFRFFILPLIYFYYCSCF